MSLIYVSHPYGGKQENKDKVEEIVRKLIKLHPENIYISPIHTFGYLYNEVDYEYGMKMCLRLLDKCDKIILCKEWTTSKGCCMELHESKIIGIPVEVIT